MQNHRVGYGKGRLCALPALTVESTHSVVPTQRGLGDSGAPTYRTKRLGEMLILPPCGPTSPSRRPDSRGLPEPLHGLLGAHLCQLLQDSHLTCRFPHGCHRSLERTGTTAVNLTRILEYAWRELQRVVPEIPDVVLLVFLGARTFTARRFSMEAPGEIAQMMHRSTKWLLHPGKV